MFGFSLQDHKKPDHMIRPHHTKPGWGGGGRLLGLGFVKGSEICWTKMDEMGCFSSYCKIMMPSLTTGLLQMASVLVS